ncbi:MAG: class I SAM-dependent methyltransferase [Candidatus Omnitrophica bacterium]|nr:class I SAM-dependent methyltransferase [Candidatus Omnitrophota bacterium]
MLNRPVSSIKEIIRKHLPIEYVFTREYRTNRFGGKISASGPGSDMAQTATVRNILALLVKELGIKTLLDAPCGDFHWMSNTQLGIENYIGVDIVQDIIKQNGRQYGRNGIEFRKLNIVKDGLPKADLILCRDCLVHFCFKDIFVAIRNFKQSGSTYLLTTTFTSHLDNRDIVTGSWQPLNLQSAPFNFLAPNKLLYENCTEESGRYQDKCLGLWKLENINIA